VPLETLCKQLLLYNNVRGEPLYPCTRILKFGVVRSPWERELSTYMHGKRGNFFKNDEYNKARFYHFHLRNSSHAFEMPTAAAYFADSRGQPLANYVLRFEHLQAGADAMLELLQLKAPSDALPHAKMVGFKVRSAASVANSLAKPPAADPFTATAITHAATRITTHQTVVQAVNGLDWYLGCCDCVERVRQYYRVDLQYFEYAPPRCRGELKGFRCSMLDERC